MSSPRSTVLGVRPTAARTSSPATSCPSARVTVTPPSARRATAVTGLSRRTSTPASLSDAATSSPAKGSVVASSLPPVTSIVTRDPKARKAVAISHATTPPPTITRWPGATVALVASRLVQGRASARPAMEEGRLASLPVTTATA